MERTVINGKTVLAVIPARGGSKRVPGKNRRFYNGKWLVAWAAEAARCSKYIDELVLSSDDPVVLEQGRKLGITSLERPAWLATENAMNEGVLVHMLYTHRWCDWTVLLQPTSPKRTSADIDSCIERAQVGVYCVSMDEYGKRNGAVYVCKSEKLISSIQFEPNMDSHFYIMPNGRSLDIDWETDFAN